MDNIHGEVKLHLQGSIVMAKLTGSFNEEGAKRYTSSVKKLIEGFQGEPFSMLINNLDLEGGTPEAYQELENYNSWLNTQCLIAKAMVQSDIATELINKLSPSQLQQNGKSFKSVEDALHWLDTVEE